MANLDLALVGDTQQGPPVPPGAGWVTDRAVPVGKELPARAPSSWQGREMLGLQDGVGGWTRSITSSLNPSRTQPAPSSNPFPAMLPGGKEEKVKHINQTSLALLPFLCHQH